MSLFQKSAKEMREMFTRGELDAVTIAQHYLDRTEVFDKEIGGYLTVLKERVLEKAATLDKKRDSGESLGKLAGLPVALKDNMNLKGEKTTCASKILENYKAPFDATVSRLIEEEDGLIIGKTNLDEFAMGSSTEYSAFQETKNPWDLDYVPGGSSGGSAAVVAGGLTPFSLGSDTGGSIRQPAAYTGTVGFKPTYGRVSRYGLVAFGSSFDTIGPFTRTVEDAALIMEALARPCSFDSTSIQANPEPYLSEIKSSIQGKVVGVPKKAKESISGRLLEIFETALAALEKQGAKIVEIDFDLIKYSIPLYYILSTAEASTNLARFDGVRYGHRHKNPADLEELYALSRQEGFGAEVKKRIMIGTFVLSSGYQDAYYRKAQKIRTLIIQDFKRIFETCDVIALPTTPTAVFKRGEVLDPYAMYLQDIFTIPANLAGIPAISLPAGKCEKGLPLGLQIMGPQMGDSEVLRFAHHLEEQLAWSDPIAPNYNRAVGS